MLKETNNYNYFEILKNNSNELFLEDNVFVDMMDTFKRNMDNILELGFLEDCKEHISSSVTIDNTKNLIVNSANIRNFTTNEDTIETINFLSSNAICIVVEPNKNMYFDIDYKMVLDRLIKSLSVDAVYSLMIHRKVQELAVVDEKGVLSDGVFEFKNKVLIDCDFQKNDTIFEYCCKAFDSVELSIAVYKK